MNSILNEQIRIGAMKVKNRLVKAAVVENMATESGEVTAKLVSLYAKATRGGAGLIFTGGAYVQPSGRNLRFQTGVHHDGLIRGLSRLAGAAKKEGARIVLQVSHGGRQCRPELTGGEVIGPSAVKDTMTGITPRAMSRNEIEETIEAFGLAAGRAREAGFDVVEFHFGIGYLISRFISPLTNSRTDQYGGSFEKRMKLPPDEKHES